MSIPIGTSFRSLRSSSAARSGEHHFSLVNQHTSNFLTVRTFASSVSVAHTAEPSVRPRNGSVLPGESPEEAWKRNLQEARQWRQRKEHQRELFSRIGTTEDVKLGTRIHFVGLYPGGQHCRSQKPLCPLSSRSHTLNSSGFRCRPWPCCQHYLACLHSLHLWQACGPFHYRSWSNPSYPPSDGSSCKGYSQSWWDSVDRWHKTRSPKNDSESQGEIRRQWLCCGAMDSWFVDKRRDIVSIWPLYSIVIFPYTSGSFGMKPLLDKSYKPDLVIFLNASENTPAIRECTSRHIPTVGIVDTDTDPRLVTYPIPANMEVSCSVFSDPGPYCWPIPRVCVRPSLSSAR